MVKGSPFGHHFRRLNSISAFHMPSQHHKHAEHNTHHIGGHQERKHNMFALSFCSHDTLPEGTGTLKSPFLRQQIFCAWQCAEHMGPSCFSSWTPLKLFTLLLWQIWIKHKLMRQFLLSEIQHAGVLVASKVN
jgi:hypothetical protein